MSEAAIVVRGLVKSYGDVRAVRGVDLTIERGEVFALLGPNGAGKTTTVEILEGYRERTAGEVSVLGFDPARHPREMRSRIGIVLQSTGIDPYLTVRETVELYAGYYPSPMDVDEAVAIVGLTEKADARVIKLSGGQQRRLDVAVALAGDPELLFLDEATTGFDPGARRNAWEIVRNLTGLGKTVFLTTHYMDEAQHLAHRVAVIAKGKIVAEGPPATLGDRHVADTVIRFRRPDLELPAAIAARAVVSGDEVELLVPDPTRTLHDLTTWALESGSTLEGLHVTQPTLEDVYLELTGEAGRE
ncbi:MAG TPA: ABC transporter ATP-binding protein [Actinomycetota bacterium]|nr:ABC transporter ATP-binding protein [Actinomycetota bacterium]